MIELAPAKINWFLNVHGYDEASGYHLVTTVLQTLDFGDRLTWRKTSSGQDVVFTSSNPVLSIKPEGNLVIRAFRQFHTAFQLPEPSGIQLDLEKETPFPAGLGGGSSDAAACLRLCKRYWLDQGHAIDGSKLHAVARTLGADVPFFIEGGCALGTGRGDEMVPLTDPSKTLAARFDLLLVLPTEIRLSTQEAYGWLRQKALASGGYAQQGVQPLIQALALVEKDLPVYNDFHAVVLEHLPALQEIEDLLRRHGATHVLLCGSGPSLFALFPRGARGKRQVEEAFPSHLYWTRWVNPATPSGHGQF